MTRSATFLVIGATAVLLAVAGCGGSSKSKSSSSASSTPAPASTSSSNTTSSSSTSGGGATLSLAADPSGQLKFNKTTLSAKAGTVTIKMSNPSSVPHGIAVEGNGVDKDGQVVQKGGTSTLTVKLKPGKYTFYCPVPGHKQAGMKGTLTVG